MESKKSATAPRAPIPIPKITDEEIYALQALDAGTASPEQQKMALKWIVYGAADYSGFCDHPESDRLSAIHDGRRFVGARIITAISLNMEVFKSKARSQTPTQEKES